MAIKLLPITTARLVSSAKRKKAIIIFYLEIIV